MLSGLITKRITPESNLGKWCNEKSIKLACQPFIETISLGETAIPKTQWVFFTSPRSVRHFFETYQKKLPKIACLSTGTAAELKLFGYTPDFIGESASNTVEIGQSFSQKLGLGEKVLFPIGNKSLRTIQNQLDNNCVEEIIVYQTNILTSKIDTSFNFFIVTSPSNAEGLLNSLQEPLENKVFIVYGKSTHQKLIALGVHSEDIKVANGFTEQDLIAQLETLSLD